MDRQVLGLVGVGKMGGPMAGRLLDAGYSLTLFDTSAVALAPLAARGARVAATPADVGSSAEVVLLSLPTPDVVEKIVLGPGGLIEGSTVRTIVDLSTSGPAMEKKLAAALAPKGITLVDSPVSGGVGGAKAGTLTLMVACPSEAFPAVEAILKHLGKVFFAGETPGLAQIAKLANNLLNAAALVVTSEAMAMGVKAGLNPKVLLDIINAGTGRNSATQDKFPRAVLTGTFDFGFAIGLLHKDVRLCVDEAEAMGVPMVVGTAIRQMLSLTSVTYGPAADFTSIARVLEGWSGVEIRAQPST